MRWTDAGAERVLVFLANLGPDDPVTGWGDWQIDDPGIRVIGTTVRSVWEQPDPQARAWAAACLFVGVAGRRINVADAARSTAFRPPPTHFERALLYLIHEADRLRVCQNPDCRRTRYFFARRRPQKYCSGQCAEPAQLELKRRWWRIHGTAWRAARS